jgi:hypothetical protein
MESKEGTGEERERVREKEVWSEFALIGKMQLKTYVARFLGPTFPSGHYGG